VGEHRAGIAGGCRGGPFPEALARATPPALLGEGDGSGARRPVRGPTPRRAGAPRPGRPRAMPQHDPAVPPGWDHNPTSLRRRAGLAVLAGAGFAVALYLALYQLGAYDTVWDPWLDSPAVLGLTEPVPDALAGVLAYGAELILLAIGGPQRWHTHPYICLALGAILVCGAVASIALIVVQPTVAGAWCLLCLVSAALSLGLFALGIEEARAAWQHVRRTGQRPARVALHAGARLRRSVH
jgi:hypothetical protein